MMFDINNINHLRAYRYLCSNKKWPENINFDYSEISEIQSRMSEQWSLYMINKIEKEEVLFNKNFITNLLNKYTTSKLDRESYSDFKKRIENSLKDNITLDNGV